MGNAGLFLDVQRVQVGAQAHGVVRVALPQHAHDAGLGKAAMDVEPE